VGDNLSNVWPRVAVNLPNYITLSRIVCIPVLIWILSSNYFSSADGHKELAAAALFLLASLTDLIDGYLARRRDQITPMGVLLDPLADKLMVTAAYVTLVQFNPRIVPAWIAFIIIGREFLVSGLRSIAASEGFTIEASDLGKVKMNAQIVSVIAAILEHRWQWWSLKPLLPFDLPIHVIAVWAIWFMLSISLISAADYFAGFWSHIHRRVERRRRRHFILRRRKGEKAGLATGPAGPSQS
jgi:CDP-diacylglycerol--glycerol-3-phosphate 3-phosphatidyltransferase